MWWIVLMVIFALVALVVFFLGKAMRKEARAKLEAGVNSSDIDDVQLDGSFGKWMMLGSIAGFFLFAGACTSINSVRMVDAGHVQVVYEFGRIVGQKTEGLQLIAPWQKTQDANIQVQKAQFVGEDRLESFSEETQDVFIDATLNYQISPRAVQQLLRNIGPDWFDKLVVPRVHQLFKDETVKYKSVDIAPSRETIRTNVRARLTEEMEQYSIDIVDLLITNIDFSPAFKAAIEAKQIATQKALEQQRLVDAARYQAEQAVKAAEGRADSEIEEARGDARALELRSIAQAEANDRLNASLTPEILQWQAIQKFADDVTIVLLPAGEGIIIDPSTLLGGIPSKSRE